LRRRSPDRYLQNLREQRAAVAAFYRERGVRPVTTFATAVLQSPVLFGLYRVLASPEMLPALQAARTQPDSLALWKGRIEAWMGPQTGDTTEVFVYPGRDGCDHRPILLRFVGSGSEARVVSASSPCLDFPRSR
jgi:hypothetical protein